MVPLLVPEVFLLVVGVYAGTCALRYVLQCTTIVQYVSACYGYCFYYSCFCLVYGMQAAHVKHVQFALDPQYEDAQIIS